MVTSFARVLLYVMVVVEILVGACALIFPDQLAREFGLAPMSITGTAELRALYGGGIVAWALMTWGALRWGRFAAGLLLAVGMIMGSLAVVRVISLVVDGAVNSTIGAGSAEALTAIACWIVYRSHDRRK